MYDDANKIVLLEKGTKYEQMTAKFEDDKRAYAFLRIETGDELSKRAKFAFIAWIGPSVSPLKRAKVSTDKGEVKKIIQNFAAEILASEMSDIRYDDVKAKVVKAGGANYGVCRGYRRNLNATDGVYAKRMFCLSDERFGVLRVFTLVLSCLPRSGTG